MEWHIWGPADSVPTIYTDTVLAQQALAQFTANDVVVMKVYKKVDAGIFLFNTGGGGPLPSMPQHIPPSKKEVITHVSKNSL